MIGQWVASEIVPTLARSVPVALVAFAAMAVWARRDRHRDDAGQPGPLAGTRRTGGLRTRAVVRHQQCAGVGRWARHG